MLLVIPSAGIRGAWSPRRLQDGGELYDLNLGPHVFPLQKYRIIHDRLLDDGIAHPS